MIDAHTHEMAAAHVLFELADALEADNECLGDTASDIRNEMREIAAEMGAAGVLVNAVAQRWAEDPDVVGDDVIGWMRREANILSS